MKRLRHYFHPKNLPRLPNSALLKLPQRLKASSYRLQVFEDLAKCAWSNLFLQIHSRHQPRLPFVIRELRLSLNNSEETYRHNLCWCCKRKETSTHWFVVLKL